MEDETMQFKRDEPQSKIFNTSVRGWIALWLSVTLGICVFLIVIAPFFNVTMPDKVSDQLLVLFASGFGAAITAYFNLLSKEGRKP